MSESEYFKRVSSMSPTRMWINNPTLRECDIAIEAGAINCTTNPTYSMKMIQKEDAAFIDGIFAKAIKGSTCVDCIADNVQQELVRNLLVKFDPLYEKSNGKQGFVSIQGNPHMDENADRIVEDARNYRKLGRNFIAKIPATEAGLAAIERLIPENIPIIATEIMSIAQMVSTCELYTKVSKSCGKTPVFFVTHITGILDDHMKNVVKEQKIDIASDILWQAGCIVARKQYRIMKDRKYPGILLGGGARDLHHFTEFVGADAHITINWEGTADKLIANNPPVVYRIDNPTPQHVVDELLEKIPDFRKAYFENELLLSDFKDFGPVVLFRNSFLKGWDYLTDQVRQRKEAM